MMYILLTDDEMPARSELRYILRQLAPEATFYEAATGAEALALVEHEPVEVLFLDIEMPDMDGLAVATAVLEGPDPPFIIFATAYDEHALRAFELAALDYVVKPFDESRLEQTMVRVRQALAEKALMAERHTAVRHYLAQHQVPLPPRLWGQQTEESWRLVDVKDILWIEAVAKKVLMHTAVGDHLQLPFTLKEVETRLESHGFLRVHKSYLVNMAYVAEVSAWFSGTFVLKMADEANTRIPMSRRYAAQIKQLTGWRR